MGSSLSFSIRLKQLGSTANLAFAAPLVDGDEATTASTDANRIGFWFNRAGGNEGIVFNVLGVDVLAVKPSSATILGNAIWHAGTFNPSLYQLLSAKGAANGYAGLDSGGKVPLAQLPASVANQMFYVSGWNANSNTPTLVSGVGSLGQIYQVTTAGVTTLDGINNWRIGDLAFFNGTTWTRVLGAPPYLDLPSAVTLIASTPTVCDSYGDDGNVMYQWDVAISNGAGSVQCYKVMAARTGVSTFVVDSTVTAGNASGNVSSIDVQLITGNITLRVTMGAFSGYTAIIRRFPSLS